MTGKERAGQVSRWSEFFRKFVTSDASIWIPGLFLSGIGAKRLGRSFSSGPLEIVGSLFLLMGILSFAIALAGAGKFVEKRWVRWAILGVSLALVTCLGIGVYSIAKDFEGHWPVPPQ